ncbi:MAG: hypothetical protein H0U43_06130 [Chthoniobacterales bacterium]|nr:hypothetical protein [Chthoniobacterales bacterium]
MQEVDTSVFMSLQSNDILLIDSTHVSKLGSDVNYIFFEILPKLETGVCVHIHDIFWPFEYPPDWIDQGRAWNEAYLLRALLQHSSRFDILYFSDFMFLQNEKSIKEQAPLLTRNSGAHVWLRVRSQ